LQFLSAFDRDYWVRSFGKKHHMDSRALGGISGGPAFIKRGKDWDLVGIAFEYSSYYDAMIFASTRAIRLDGTIDKPLF
jgi:hypothetical protein